MYEKVCNLHLYDLNVINKLEKNTGILQNSIQDKNSFSLVTDQYKPNRHPDTNFNGALTNEISLNAEVLALFLYGINSPLRRLLMQRVEQGTALTALKELKNLNWGKMTTLRKVG
ncbi:UNVERIFIED_CONTAM: hypothetical protein NCL1_22728 [Trichonephila clavipes]